MLTTNAEDRLTLFGQRLQHIRKLRGYTQEALGAMLGVLKQQVYRWEKGINDPTGEQLTKIAKALEVSTDYLLGLVDDFDGRLSGEDLDYMERRMVDLLRAGAVVEALDAFTTLVKVSQRGDKNQES